MATGCVPGSGGRIGTKKLIHSLFINDLVKAFTGNMAVSLYNG